MDSGLELTFSVLAKTQNEAAVRVLLTALDSPDESLQIGALRALLARRSATAERELLGRWHTMSKGWKDIIVESSGRLSGAIRDAVLSSDEQLHRNGCEAMLLLREYDLIPTLLTAAEDPSNPRADLSVQTLLSLADALREEVDAPRDYRRRGNLDVVCAHVAVALEHSVERFDYHKRREIVEAFLVMAGRDNLVLNRILQHPHDQAYVTLLHLLSHSPRPGVMRLILDSLDDARTPSAIYSILARRKDIRFVRHMLKRFADEVPKTAKGNLKRIDSFSWLPDNLNLLSTLSGEEQRGAIHLAMASGLSRLQVFQVVDYILTHGAEEGRRAAAKVLPEFRGVEADAAVLRILHDDDSVVRAIAVGQLRKRRIRGAMTTLLELVDCPVEAVREAARESLTDFTFERFLATFTGLDEESRVETGRFVKRVDPNALDELKDELKSPIRVRRIRAIQMAVAMESVPDCESAVIALLSDDDHVIRAAAAEALVQSPSPTSQWAVRDTLFDRSQSVREAAERTLQALATSEMVRQPAPRPLPSPPGPTPSPETGETIS